MSFGGKRLRATGKRPSIPHHPRAKLRRWLDRRTWGHVEMSLNGIVLLDVDKIGFTTEYAECAAAYAIPSDEGNALVIECVRRPGHDGPHLTADGSRWWNDERGDLVVMLPGRIEYVTTTIRVKP
jgi:hypothetical protein